MTLHRVGLIGGDGIGPEVVAEAMKVVSAVGVRLDTVDYDLGASQYLRTGEALPDSVLAELRRLDAIFLGAIGPPVGSRDVPPGALERGLLPDLPGSVSEDPAPAPERAGEDDPASNPLTLNDIRRKQGMAEVPATTLVVLGEGPLHDALEHLAREHGVEDRIRLAGVRPDARAIVGAADAIVFSSTWEGLPLAALEALAAGTPVVATSVRGLRELLTDGQDALLVIPEDSRALAAALRRVLDDPDLAARLAEGGRALAAANSEDVMIRRYLELYEVLLAR